MWQLVARSALFWGIGLCLFAALYAVSSTVAPVYPEASERMDLLKRKKDSIKVVTTGNSHNVAIDFETLGVNGFHLWRGAEDLFETRYTLEDAVPRLPNLECVLMPASYFVLRRDNAASPSTNHAQRRRDVYGSTPSLSYIDGDLRNFFVAKLAPITRTDHWKGVPLALLGKEPSPGRFEVRDDGWIAYFEDQDSLSHATLKAYSKEEVLDNISLQEEMVENHPDLVQDAYDAWEDIAAYLEKRQIPLVIFTPPYYTKYTQQFDRETIDEMKTLVRRLVDHYSNVTYYDFSQDTAFVRRSAYYRDADHLNVHGAKAFSAELKTHLIQAPETRRCLE